MGAKITKQKSKTGYSLGVQVLPQDYIHISGSHFNQVVTFSIINSVAS